MMNCFCGMVDRRKAFGLISSRDHCQRSSPSRISDTPWAGFEPVQNLSSGFVEWSCAVVMFSDVHFRMKVWFNLFWFFSLVILNVRRSGNLVDLKIESMQIWLPFLRQNFFLRGKYMKLHHHNLVYENVSNNLQIFCRR